jgi:hypothetical protein
MARRGGLTKAADIAGPWCDGVLSGQPVKRRQALLGSNLLRNSRWKLTAMSHEADVRMHAGLMR